MILKTQTEKNLGFHGNIIPELSTSQFWSILYDALRKSNNDLPEYLITHGFGVEIKTSKATPEEILNILENETILAIESKEQEGNKFQNFLYNSKNGVTGLNLSLGSNLPPVEFSRELPTALVNTNFLLKDLEYSINETKRARQYRESLSPSPNSYDLYLFPACGSSKGKFLQAVGSLMWFGEAFWQHAACTKEDVIAAEWLEVEERENHIYVQAWPHPFDRNEGEQREIQLRLLKLLFGIEGPREQETE